jgi:hypothetical protein
MAAAYQDPIVFRGAPDALEAIVPVPPELRRSIRIDLNETYESGDAVVPRLLTSAVDTTTTLVRLVASPTWAPGTYAGRVSSDAGEFEATVEVVPQNILTLRPPSLDFRMSPGTSATIDVLIENTGNVPATLRNVYTVGMLEDDAIDDAIGAGLRMRERAPGESRFEVVGDELVSRYAGAARVRIEGLDEPVAPGETSRATVRLSLPRRGQAGRHYDGMLLLEGTRVPVTVTTPSRKPSKSAPEGATPTEEPYDEADDSTSD